MTKVKWLLFRHEDISHKQAYVIYNFFLLMGYLSTELYRSWRLSHIIGPVFINYLQTIRNFEHFLGNFARPCQNSVCDKKCKQTCMFNNAFHTRKIIDFTTASLKSAIMIIYTKKQALITWFRLIPFSAGTVFIRQNLTSMRLKELKDFYKWPYTHNII